MLPWASNDGSYQSPPPELTPGLPHKFWSWFQDHSGAPVLAFSAHKIPWPPAPYTVFTLAGTVDTYTVPLSKPGAMAMPSWSLPISVRLHSCAPVLASRATAALAVAAYTTPPTTLTPSGPPFGES